MTIALSSKKEVTISKIIPITNLMKRAIFSFKPETQEVISLIAALLRNIESRFSNIERSKLHAIETLLDPRFKDLDFISQKQVHWRKTC